MLEFLKEQRVIVYHFIVALLIVVVANFLGAPMYNSAVGAFGLGVMYKFYQLMNKKKTGQTFKQAGLDLLPVAFGTGAGVLVKLLIDYLIS